VVGGLEAGVLVSDLVCGMAGKDSGDVEDYGRFLKSERVLRGGLVSKCIEPSCSSVPSWTLGSARARSSVSSCLPGELYFDMILVHRKPQIKKLQLAIVPV
jgi:hypothetical protein